MNRSNIGHSKILPVYLNVFIWWINNLLCEDRWLNQAKSCFLLIGIPSSSCHSVSILMKIVLVRLSDYPNFSFYWRKIPQISRNCDIFDWTLNLDAVLKVPYKRSWVIVANGSQCTIQQLLTSIIYVRKHILWKQWHVQIPHKKP